jgi:LCP family protein required for cell wall assembly
MPKAHKPKNWSLILSGVYLLVFFAFRLFLHTTALGQYVDPAKNFIFGSQADVLQENGRTNILVMGRGGEGHEAPDLTDTMMFISIAHDKSAATMISIPRDLWVEDLKAKINSAYHYGKKNHTGGLEMAKSSVSKSLGQPVHYAVVIDFSGFKKVIDALGGVEVDVENSFIDHKYPIAGRENDLCGGDLKYLCRYETIEFQKGRQFMDGERALKYVRSRHAEGDEGTDLARSARQQRLITAIKEKTLTADILFNTQKIQELVVLGQEIVETDIPIDASGVLARRAYEARDLYKSYVLPEELLVVPLISRLYDRQYVFIPKASFEEIHAWVTTVLP